MNLTTWSALAVIGGLGVTLTSVQGPADGPDLPVPDSFLRERGGQKDAAKDALEGQAPPALDVRSWRNSDPFRLEDQRGKVVVLVFWSLASEPSVAAFASWNALQERESDLVLLGIHVPDRADELPKFVEAQGLTFPLCVDNGGTFRAYAADSFPDYYLIDRRGNLRVADLADDSLAPALRVLLAEPDPGPLAAVEAAREASSMRFANAGHGNGLDYWQMRNELFQERNETLLRVQDESMMVSQGLQPLAWKVIAENNERLTPRRIQKYRGGAIGKTLGREWVESFRFTRTRTQLLVDWGDLHGHGVETKLPLDTVVDLLLPRIVTQLPLEDGNSESFPLLEIWPFVEERDHQVLARPAELLNRGIETVNADSRRPVEAWRFDLELEGELMWSFWVDGDRNLVQVGLGKLQHLVRVP